MRMPMIAGNWKMNTTLDEATRLVEAMLPELDQIDNVDKVVCPPFISLATVGDVIKGSSVKLGAQNMYFEEKGAYTGEVSPLMLADLCQFVIIGHSERRQYFHETGEVVNKKIAAAHKMDLKPILCIGEKLDEYEAGKTEQVVTNQLRAALADIRQPDSLVIAYEPIWAIGTGKAATGQQANEIIGIVRWNVAKLYDEEMAEGMRILYGGSVTASNIAEFICQPEIDGALVGGASLKVQEFVGIVKQTAEIKQPR